MNIKHCFTFGASLFAIAAIASIATGATANRIYYPYGPGTEPLNPTSELVRVDTHDAPNVAPGKNKSGKWVDVSTALPFTHGPWGPMQMTDGSVIILDWCSNPGQWYRLTPDKKGNYTDGSWSKIAPMPNGYSPLFFAQQVLPDGRLIISGGQYNNCAAYFTTEGALYDPVSNAWSSVNAPNGWSATGDAESIILPNGSYMLADCCVTPGVFALGSIHGSNVNWTIVNGWSCGDNWCDSGEGLTALPDGDVLLVDAWDYGSNYNDYWIYDTAASSWSLAGRTADFLGLTTMGAAALTPQGPKGGTIVQVTTDATSGVNDIYSVEKGKWTSGPVMKVGSTPYIGNGPAATLPDGNILVQASPGMAQLPSHFWEFSIDKKGDATGTRVNDPKEAAVTTSFEGNLLILPTGQALWDNSQSTPNEVALYTPKGEPKANWLPRVSSVSDALTIGSTGNAISGTNFNGWDLGGAFGNNAQAATNFPLVRITNSKSGNVCFARSYNFSTMGVWTQGTTNAQFDIPDSCETGAGKLQVIVNGIASKAVSVTLNG